MIGRSTQPIVGTMEITEIMDIAGTVNSNPLIKKRRGLFIVQLMQISGVRFIILMDMIWKSAKLFWTARRCHHQHRWRKSCNEANTFEPIPTMRIR
jgi:hypothetical protein